MSKQWSEIREFTFEIKKFAEQRDYDSAIILCDDLKKYLKKKQSSGVKEE